MDECTCSFRLLREPLLGPDDYTSIGALIGWTFTCRCLDLHIVDGLHEARSGHQESTVAHPSGCGNDLAPAPMQSLRGNSCIQNLEFHIPDRLITKRPFPGAPLESLHKKKVVREAASSTILIAEAS